MFSLRHSAVSMQRALRLTFGHVTWPHLGNCQHTTQFRSALCHISGDDLRLHLARVAAFVDLPLQFAARAWASGMLHACGLPMVTRRRAALIFALEHIRRLPCRRDAQSQARLVGIPQERLHLVWRALEGVHPAGR